MVLVKAYKDDHERIKVSPNFTLDEFRCKCHRDSCISRPWDNYIHPELISNLEFLRRELELRVGRPCPIMINSGGRCVWYHHYLGSKGYEIAKYSTHLLWKQKEGNELFFASDVSIIGITYEEGVRLTKEILPNARIGSGKGILHIDVAYYSNPIYQPAWRKGERWFY
jgi:hypothetical protein